MKPITIADIISVTHGRLIQPGRMRKARGVSIDSRSLRKGDLFIAIQGDRCDGHDFVAQAVKEGAAGVIVSRAVGTLPESVTVIKVANTTYALGRIAGFYRQQFHVPVIAITGSAGKTTTKDMIAQVLSTKYHVLKNEKSFNNCWGVPLTILSLSGRHDLAILEVGTNHPGEIAYLADIVRPTVAVFTNIGLAHLQGFKDLESVFKEKKSLLNHLDKKGSVVFHYDDPCLNRLGRLKWKSMCFGLLPRADIRADQIRLNEKGDIHFRVNKRHVMMIKTPVMENVLNALAAVCCGRLLGISFSDIRQGLARARFTQARQQIERINGYVVINDSYNSNPVSFRSALRTLLNMPAKGRRIVVCGDMLELGRQARMLHREIGHFIGRSDLIDSVFSFGHLSEHIGQEAKKVKSTIGVRHFHSMPLLQRHLRNVVSEGDVVLIKGSRAMKMERVLEYLRG